MSIYNIRPGVLLCFFSQVHSTIFEDKEEQQCDTHFKKVCWYVFSSKTRGYLLVEYIQGVPKRSGRFFKNGCGIQMSQATPTKFSMLFKHNYGKLFCKFGDHRFNLSFVHGPSLLRVLESIHRYGVIFTF